MTLFMMLDDHSSLLQISAINLHTTKLSLDLPNSILLLMRCSVAEGKVHVLQGLEELSALRAKVLIGSLE